MESRQTDYPQSGLSEPYPTFPEPASEGSSADQASAAQYSQGQDPRSTSTFSASATPTTDYAVNPATTRTGSFNEYIQPHQPHQAHRPYQPSAQAATAGGAMAQPQSPSLPLQDAQNSDHTQQLKSDSDVPIDPSIAAATSPTYPPQYSPYQPHGADMHTYPPNTPMYAAQRPEWNGQQYPPHSMHFGHPSSSGPTAPAMSSPAQRPPPVGHSGHYPFLRTPYQNYVRYS